MQYKGTTGPGFQTMDNVFQPKTLKMPFPHSPVKAILPRQHQQCLLFCRVLGQEKHTDSAREHRGAEQCCAPRQEPSPGTPAAHS